LPFLAISLPVIVPSRWLAAYEKHGRELTSALKSFGV
jgi:hypothetical protein